MPKYHKKSKQAKVPYHKKPEEMTVEQWQTELRRQFARDGKQKFTIKYLGGEHPVFGDYSVKNLLSGGSYKVALRSGKPGLTFAPVWILRPTDLEHASILKPYCLKSVK